MIEPAPSNPPADPSPQARDALATIVAFYLPQFHRIPENDAWWGDGFTEWTNVRRAVPQFPGHEQPAIPTELGYYNLTNPEIHHAQAALARQYGIGAFCYYAYWFAGRRLLEQPLELVLRESSLAMPYAICWANETWSRRWDGSESEVLVEQRHSPDSDPGFVEAVADHLADPRYIRIDGRPLLLIYRPGLLSEPLKTTDALRARAVQLGLPEPYLAMVQSFGHWEPVGYGFDAAVEFPPHNLGVDPATDLKWPEPVEGNPSLISLSYEAAVRTCLTRAVPRFPWFRGVMPAWDNTPRRRSSGTVFRGATNELFRAWLEAVLEFTYLFQPPGRRFVFVNAWNEWAEGTYLEPDSANGVRRLEAVRDALRDSAGLALETSDARLQALLERAQERWLS